MRVDLHLQCVQIRFSALLLLMDKPLGILVNFLNQPVVSFGQYIGFIAAVLLQRMEYQIIPFEVFIVLTSLFNGWVIRRLRK